MYMTGGLVIRLSEVIYVVTHPPPQHHQILVFIYTYSTEALTQSMFTFTASAIKAKLFHVTVLSQYCILVLVLIMCRLPRII